jgi:hypothetical protein
MPSEPTPPTGLSPEAKSAADREDPYALAQAASEADLEKLHLAEEFFEKRHHRKKRSTRFAIASQALVGYVAFAGLGVNAYQSYSNYQKQLRQQDTDNERWNKEFERAKEADKYRAFFETSVLATDPTNADKRLVGYALLEEFVEDKAYNSKATLMLEESLLQELRGDTSASGLDDAHRNAVVAILTSLSQTSDCHALERPARSIGKIARHHQQTNDIEETTEVFEVYVRRVIGRAALICPTMKEFRGIRQPIRETLVKIPEVGGLKGKVRTPDANAKIAEILINRCTKELSVSGASDCVEIYAHYEKLCAATAKKDQEEDAESCRLIAEASAVAAAAHLQAEKSAETADAGAP